MLHLYAFYLHKKKCFVLFNVLVPQRGAEWSGHTDRTFRRARCVAVHPRVTSEILSRRWSSITNPVRLHCTCFGYEKNHLGRPDKAKGLDQGRQMEFFKRANLRHVPKNNLQQRQ